MLSAGLKLPPNPRRAVRIPDYIRRLRRAGSKDVNYIGEPVSRVRKEVRYASVRFQGKEYQIGDDVLVETPPNVKKNSWKTEKTKASVCRIADLWSDGGEGWMKVYWYYYPEHTLCGDVFKKNCDYSEASLTYATS